MIKFGNFSFTSHHLVVDPNPQNNSFKSVRESQKIYKFCMSCQVGQSGWQSTTNNACFFSQADGQFRDCLCPIAACVLDKTTGLHNCQMTVQTQFGIALLMLGFVVSLFLYLHASAYASSQVLLQTLTNDVELVPRDVLFGVYSASYDDDPHEKRPLLPPRSLSGSLTGGGTFHPTPTKK